MTVPIYLVSYSRFTLASFNLTVLFQGCLMFMKIDSAIWGKSCRFSYIYTLNMFLLDFRHRVDNKIDFVASSENIVKGKLRACGVFNEEI
jgi:hypothetical protein